MDSSYSSSGSISKTTSEFKTTSANDSDDQDISYHSTHSLSNTFDDSTGFQHSSSKTTSEVYNDHLPQPQNSNYISSAPLKEKLLTNSSYLAAEIPLKFGHFMNHLWMSGSEFLSDPTGLHNSNNQQSGTEELWLLGCRYDMPNNIGIQMQQDMLEAQKDDLFVADNDNYASSTTSSSPSSPAPPAPPPPTTTTSSTSSVSLSSSYHREPINQHTVESSSSSNTIKRNTTTATTAAVMSVLWPPDFYSDFTSRFWMTYRHNYPPIRPSHYKTDIGWGCMLRSGQSLLANALLIHFLSRDWRRTDPSDPTWKTYTKIAHWFLDELSPRAPFSIHRIALLGKQLGKNIGEWFGPSTISQVIQALVSDFPDANMAVYIATDGVIYRKDVHDVATGKKPRGDFGYLNTRTPMDVEREEARTIYTLSNSVDQHNNDIFNTNTNQDPSPTQPPFKSTLILVAIRLGIDSLHPSYYPALKTCFRLPYFVGIAGGRPNSSLYFMGLQDDELIYIDPHFSRSALETKSLVDYTAEDLATYHCTIPRKIHISQVDPSMMLGFYCRTQDDFDIFCEQINQIGQRYSAIFTIQEQAPEYEEDVRSEHDFGVISDEDDEDKDELNLVSSQVGQENTL